MMKHTLTLFFIAVMIIVLGSAFLAGQSFSERKYRALIADMGECGETALETLDYECAATATDILSMTDIGIPEPLCRERDRLKESFIHKALKELRREGWTR